MTAVAGRRFDPPCHRCRRPAGESWPRQPRSRSVGPRCCWCFAAPGTGPGNPTGDANGDRKVDLDDFDLVKVNFGQQSDLGDLDGDHFVDLEDFAILKNTFGLSLPQPSPAAALENSRQDRADTFMSPSTIDAVFQALASNEVQRKLSDDI